MNHINLIKNVAIAGGLLALSANDAGTLSADGWLAARRAKGGAL